MKLTILGSGTGIPLIYRASPSLTVTIDNSPVLFDFGPGILRQLTRAGLNHERIAQIFLTHFHPDHTADLIHFLFATKNPSTLKRRAPFVITGPTGLKEFIDRLQQAFSNWLILPPEIMRIEELDVSEKVDRNYKNFKITTCPTKHTPHSIAYRIEDASGKIAVYSGDTGFCKEIIDLARGAHVLILECSFPNGQETDGHLTPSEAGKIADLARVNRLVLTHFYPECLATDIAAQCRKSYGGELSLGSDLMSIHL